MEAHYDDDDDLKLCITSLIDEVLGNISDVIGHVLQTDRNNMFGKTMSNLLTTVAANCNFKMLKSTNRQDHNKDNSNPAKYDCSSVY